MIKRYKRFLADVEMADGEVLTVHCPNTGAMTGCAEPGSMVWLSTSNNPKRKYAHTWELLKVDNNMVCVHSSRANALVLEAIENEWVQELSGYDSIRTEVKYGDEGSRIDLLLANTATQAQCYVEVKSVTLLMDGSGLGIFPDAVSDRGRKHLRELMVVAEQGHRAVLFFAVLHTGIVSVAPADAIDGKYADTYREAIAAGVEVIAYGAEITSDKIRLRHRLATLSRSA